MFTFFKGGRKKTRGKKKIQIVENQGISSSAKFSWEMGGWERLKTHYFLYYFLYLGDYFIPERFCVQKNGRSSSQAQSGNYPVI